VRLLVEIEFVYLVARDWATERLGGIGLGVDGKYVSIRCWEIIARPGVGMGD